MFLNRGTKLHGGPWGVSQLFHDTCVPLSSIKSSDNVLYSVVCPIDVELLLR